VPRAVGVEGRPYRPTSKGAGLCGFLQFSSKRGIAVVVAGGSVILVFSSGRWEGMFLVEPVSLTVGVVVAALLTKTSAESLARGGGGPASSPGPHGAQPHRRSPGTPAHHAGRVIPPKTPVSSFCA
jgi:hypothetical protein